MRERDRERESFSVESVPGAWCTVCLCVMLCEAGEVRACEAEVVD